MTASAVREITPGVERIRETFQARGYAQDALKPRRCAALERFLALGFPTRRDERWKYTDLRRLESRDFALAEQPAAAQVSVPTLADAGLRVVLVDGHCMPSLGSHSAQPPGVTAIGLGHWIQTDPAAAARFLEQAGIDGDSAFENLNAAFVEDGVIIDIAANTRWDEPIHVLHAWQTSGRMAHPRIIVRLGAGSRCTLIEQYIGPPGVESFTNVVVSIDAQPGACLEHYRVQQESSKSVHVSTVRARLGRDAHYHSHGIALGASLGRAQVAVTLEGTGAETRLRGLFTPSGNQHLDNYTLIEHVAPHTRCEQEYRGIADGRGRGVFNGKVKVHPHAQKIDARQLSRNLLLSATAEIDTKPELEIYANEVKCSHGATTGQLDDAALFYLRSRGIDAAQARVMLIRAFAESIVDTIEPQGLRNALEGWLKERFAPDDDTTSKEDA